MHLAVAALVALLSMPALADETSGWDHVEVDGFDLLYNGLVSELGGDLRALALARTRCTPASVGNPNADCIYMNDLLRFSLTADEDGTPSRIDITVDLDDISDRLTTMISVVVATLDRVFSPEEAGRHMGTLLKRSFTDGRAEETLRATRYEVVLDQDVGTFRVGLRNAAVCHNQYRLLVQSPC